MNILQLLEREEGYRAKPYYCSEGYPTVGIGKKIGPQHAPLELYQFEVSREMADLWLCEEVSVVIDKLIDHEWFCMIDEHRKNVIVSMAYQMGVSGLLKFKNMIKALNVGDFDEAARQALDSRWAKQTPQRANRHAESLRTGVVI